MADSIEDGGSHFVVPSVSQKDMSTMTREEWMQQYGDVLSSEIHYLKRDPDWDRNKKSWWYAMTGRDGEEPPLWMQEEWHRAELDYRVGGDRHTAPVDAREEKPLWAERMNLDGEKQGPQSSTVFGHRQEYLPAHKSRARSMVRGFP